METTEMTVNTTTPVMSQVQTSHGEGYSISTENSVESISETPVFESDAPKTTIEEESAHSLLASAKDEGFENALIHLSEGDFDIKEGEEEILDEAEPISADKDPRFAEKKAEDGEIIEDGETQIKEPTPEEAARMEMMGRMKDLELQVTNLDERNKELASRLKDADILNNMAMQTLMEMTHALSKLVEEEKDENDKVSLLEILVMVMGEMLQVLYKPQETEIGGDQEKVVQYVDQPSKKGGNSESAGKIVQYLKEKGSKIAGQNGNAYPHDAYAHAA